MAGVAVAEVVVAVVLDLVAAFEVALIEVAIVEALFIVEALTEGLFNCIVIDSDPRSYSNVF